MIRIDKYMDKIELTKIGQLDQLIIESNTQTIVIFKHSIRCGISKFVLKDFENQLNKREIADFKYYYLDLINFRNISNEISTRFSIQHESPQLIIIKTGEVVHHSSHSEISAESINLV